MKRFMNIAAWLILVSLLLFMGRNLYLLYYPIKSIEIYDQPIQIDNPKVKAGEAIFYHINYCKFTDKSATVARQLVGKETNKSGYSIVQIDTLGVVSNVPKGCKNLTTSLIIPENVLPGIYHMRATSTYKLNELRDSTVVWETQEFEVIE